MPIRWCAAGLVLALAGPVAPAWAQSCSGEAGRLMSKDTEKLTTRYNRIIKQIESRGSTAKLLQEECRIARQLRPRLEDQLAALKQSGCLKDPEVGGMLADIVRGHEDDLALARKTTSRSDCR